MPKYGLIGEKLGHSFSPLIHSQLHDYDYGLYEVAPENLSEFMKNTELSGFNVTIPYKQAVIPFCSELSEAARTIGSVNTVLKKPDGSFFGDNTDYYGFEYLLNKSGINIASKKALILGNGGAAKTVHAVLQAYGADTVITVSRKGPVNYENLSAHFDAQIIVNCTPVGMFPNVGSCVIDVKNFTNCELALDLIYNPCKTEFLLQAEALGIPAFNGLSMLVAQAKKAGEIFTDSLTDDKMIDIIEKKISAETMNIVLIGMPGSGKTTIGQILAEKTERGFIDMDEEIEKYARKTIPQIFEESSESGFRQVETEVLKQVSPLSGKIIATGGGIVTVPDNKKLLNQNSRVVLIERELSALPSDGRPLSLSHGVEVLYKTRKPLYDSWADITVKNENPCDAADEIIRVFEM